MAIQIDTRVAHRLAEEMERNANKVAKHMKEAYEIFTGHGDGWKDNQAERFNKQIRDILPHVKSAAIQLRSFSEDLEKRIKELEQ